MEHQLFIRHPGTPTNQRASRGGEQDNQTQHQSKIGCQERMLGRLIAQSIIGIQDDLANLHWRDTFRNGIRS